MIPYPTPLWSRLLSFTLAVAACAGIVVFSKEIAALAGGARAAAIMLLLWGAAAGFVHGVGFVPRHAIWRVVFHPLGGWLYMAAGSLLI